MTRILLAEDEEVLRMLVVDTVEDEGYEVDEASDGEEALELIQQNQYDLVILDYMMPIMTGLEVVEKIRECAELHIRESKILMLSAKSQQSDQNRVKAAGVDYFISKPFSPLELVNRIGEILND